jgi:hypothetical protein
MNLPSLSSSRSLRGLVVVAGFAALSLLTVACGDDDDDDDDDVQAGSGGEGGSGGKGGAGGKGGSGGTGGKSGSGGSGGGGSGGSGGAMEEDAGMLDDAGEDPGPNPDNFRNVTFMMTGLTIEVGEFMQFRLISADGDLITIGVIHGVPAAAFPFELPHSAPAGEVVTFEAWADTMGTTDNAYEAGMDQAWTGTIAAGDADVDAVVPIAGGLQATPPTLTQGVAAGSLGFTMMNTSAHSGDLFELRVLDNDTGRLVGRQLLPVPGNQIGLEVFGVIHAGVEYQVDYAIDLDGDSAYDAPPTDAAWRTLVTATEDGYNADPDAGIGEGGATITLSGVPSSASYVDVGF